MKVSNLTEHSTASLGKAANEAGVILNNLRTDGNGFRFTLALDGERYRRLSHMGKKVAAVCWHGHREFMLNLFTYEPNAKLVTAMATYDGVDEFCFKATDTGFKNIGSIAKPMKYIDACTCKKE